MKKEKVKNLLLIIMVIGALIGIFLFFRSYIKMSRAINNFVIKTHSEDEKIINVISYDKLKGYFWEDHITKEKCFLFQIDANYRIIMYDPNVPKDFIIERLWEAIVEFNNAIN